MTLHQAISKQGTIMTVSLYMLTCKHVRQVSIKRYYVGFLGWGGGGHKKATYLANQTFPAVWCFLSRFFLLVPNTFGVAEENTKTCQ